MKIHRFPVAAAIVFLLYTPAASGESLPESVRDFLTRHCLDCHSGEAAEGGVSLDLTEIDWTLPHATGVWERVHDVVADEEMPPPDADQPGANDRRAFVDWLHDRLLHHAPVGGTVPRRLNREEYQNSIRALFDLPTFEVPDAFPADDSTDGFDNVGEGLILSPPLMAQYLEVATRVADEILPPDLGPIVINPRRYAIGTSGLATSEGGARTDDRFRIVSSRNMASIAVWPNEFEAPVSGVYRLTIDTVPFQTGKMFYDRRTEPFRIVVYARKKTDQVYDPLGDVRRVAEFDVQPDKTSTQAFHLDVELFRGEIFGLHWENGPCFSDAPSRDYSTRFLASRLKASRPLYAAISTLGEVRGMNQVQYYEALVELMNSGTLDVDDPRYDTLPEKYGGGLGGGPHNLIMMYVHEEMHRYGPAVDVTDVAIEGPLRLVEDDDMRAAKARTRRFLGVPPERQSAGVLSTQDSVEAVLERFLSQAFRRPVSEERLRDYVQVVMRHISESPSARIEDGLHVAVRRALVSPGFLYRGIRPGRLDDFDLATRLSFFLTSSPPDTTLTAAAGSGQLADPEVLERETRRLLDSPECLDFVRSFTGQWLGTRRLRDIMPDPRLLPFYDAHRQALVKETELFFAEMLRENLPLESFIDPGFSYRSALLNSIYGGDLKSFEMERVTFDRGGRHGGILGLASVMMATANGVDTQPVLRGVWLLENVFGTPTPEPPGDVPAIASDTSGATNIRELLEAHKADQSCARCHRKIDPPGMVLENFDPVGRWRDNYPIYVAPADGEKELDEEFYANVGNGTQAGPPVDASGVLQDGTPLKDVTDLKRYVLANIDMFSSCLTEKLLIYSTGRRLSFGDRQVVDQIVRDVKTNGNGFRDLILAIVLSDAFATR